MKGFKFYQIKAIRKGCKPPLWRRAFVPMNITYTQLAIVLEELLEIDKSPLFGFEFYKAGYRLIEWNEEFIIPDYRFTYLDASENYVNDLFDTEKSFTFRMLGKNNSLPEYKVEIEKRGCVVTNDIEQLSYPFLTKAKSDTEDKYWSSGHQINGIYKNNYKLSNGKDSYDDFGAALKKIEKQGLSIGDKAESRQTKVKQSTSAMLSQLGDMLGIVIKKKQEERRQELGYADDYQFSDEENKDLIEEIAEDIKQKMMPKIDAAIMERAINIPAPTAENLEVNLCFYHKDDLKYIAKRSGFNFESKLSKKKLAYELARYLLDADTMRTLMYSVPIHGLDLFEQIAESNNTYSPNEKDYLLVSELLDRNYIYELEYNKADITRFVIPTDVLHVYNIIKKNGYRKKHTAIRWMFACLYAISKIYCAVPVKFLYKLYKTKKDIDTDYDSFMDTYNQIPEYLKEATIIGDFVVGNDYIEEDMYKHVLAQQEDINYRILTADEISVLEQDRMPSNLKEYQRMMAFFVEIMGLDYYDAWDYTIRAFVISSIGGDVKLFIEELNNNDVIFPSDKAFKDLVKLYDAANFVTGKFNLRGNTQDVLNYLPISKQSKEDDFSNIVPFDSYYFDDLNMPTSTVHAPKKVYPNDPCPCGSGKKYKKCCGRK